MVPALFLLEATTGAQRRVPSGATAGWCSLATRATRQQTRWRMGVLYSVLSVDDETRERLESMGVPDLPETNGRNPTLAEVKAVVAALEGVSTTCELEPDAVSTWSILVEEPGKPGKGAWTQIRGDHGGEAEPTDIWCSKGWPELILKILVRLAVHTGPIVVLANGESPLLVRDGDDPDELCRRWDVERSTPDSPFRIVFLDVDGVLNSDRYVAERPAPPTGELWTSADLDPALGLTDMEVERAIAPLSRAAAVTP